MDSKTPGKSTPAADAQRRYITRNASILDDTTKETIFRLVMLEGRGDDAIQPGDAEGAGSPEDDPLVLVVTGGKRRVQAINFDKIRNLEVLSTIYNIVRNRREELSQPVTKD